MVVFSLKVTLSGWLTFCAGGPGSETDTMKLYVPELVGGPEIAPVVAAIVWGLFVSPKARFPLSRPLWVGVQVVLFGAAVVGLVASGQGVLGSIFGVAVAVNLALVLIWSETGTVTPRA